MGTEKRTTPRNVIESHRQQGHNRYAILWTDEDCVPCTPTDANPGTDDKLRVLADRAEHGEALWSGEDGIGPCASFADITAWVDSDLEQDMRRRVWRLVDPVLVEVDQIALYGRQMCDWGSYLYVDLVAMTGCAMSVHLRDRDEWASLDVVKDQMDSKQVQSLFAAVGGDKSAAEEVIDG